MKLRKKKQNPREQRSGKISIRRVVLPTISYIPNQHMDTEIKASQIWLPLYFCVRLGGSVLYFNKWSTIYRILPCHYVSWRGNNLRLTSSPVFGSLSLSLIENRSWRHGDGGMMGWPSDGYLAATIMRVLKIFSWVYFFFFWRFGLFARGVGIILFVIFWNRVIKKCVKIFVRLFKNWKCVLESICQTAPCSVEFMMVWGGHRVWDYIYMCTFEIGLNYGLQWWAIQYNLWIKFGFIV